MNETIIRTEYSEVMEQSYIDYAMSASRCEGRLKAGSKAYPL